MQDASSSVATAPCAQGPSCSYPATLVAQTGAPRGPGAGTPERSRASERLEASMAGLAELELLRRRHEALVRGVLEAPASADQDQHHRHQHPHQHHSGSVSARQQPLERDFVESLRAMKEQLRDLGLLSRLRHLNEQFSELKMDMDRAAVKQSETDSRPSSGYYDLSDGSLSNSCNSIFSDCLSGSRSSLGSCSPPGRAAPSPASPAAAPAAAETHPGFTSELPLFRGPGEHPREMCGPLPAAGATAAAKVALQCPQQQGRARERPLSSGDLLRLRSETSGAGTATRRSLPDDPTPGPPPPAGCPSARGAEASGRYVSDLTSRDGSDVYRYPSPLHAVAIQSPLFLHCPGAASGPHDAMTSRRPGGSERRPCSGFVPSPGPVPLSRDGVANERVSGYICSLLDRKRAPGASGGNGVKLSRMESFNAGPNMPITNGRLKPKHEEKPVTLENINLGADLKPDTLQCVDSCKEVIPEKNVQTINESETPRCHQQRSEPSPSPKSKEQPKLIANVLPLICNDSPKRTGGLPSHLSRVKGSSRVERYEEDSKPSSSRVSHQVPRGTHATPGKGVELRYRDATSKQQIVEERFALPKDRSRALNVSNHGAVIKATHGKLDKRTGGRNVVPRAQPRADAGNCRTSNGHVLLKGNRSAQPHHRSMESVESRRKGSGRKTAIKSSKKYGTHADWNGNKRLGPTKARPPKVEEQRARRRDEDRMQNPAACAERCCRDAVSRVDGRDCRKSAAAAAGGSGRGVKRLAPQPKGRSREPVQPHGAAHGRVPAPPLPQQQPRHRRRPAPARVRVHPPALAPALAHVRMARAYATAVARADSDSERSEYSAECESLFHGTVMDTSEDEMSDHTTNRFGDGETSASEGVPCSEVDDDDRDDDDEEEEEVATDSDSDGDAGGFSVSTGSSASDEEEEDDVDTGGRQQSKGLPLAGRRGGQKAPVVAAPVAARGPEARGGGGGGVRGQQHAACRIKASRSLKKKMMHFRSGSLKVITTV
ncbi:dapper homolog 1 isoform X2 [Petromyzon marinus]|uniref:dapper homolog 1 isoform X2 n=1 Tax=Petromyzon marinus TaxID=7757 RepID=UPI003F70D587